MAAVYTLAVLRMADLLAGERGGPRRMLQINQAENQDQKHSESRDDFGRYDITHKIFLSS